MAHPDLKVQVEGYTDNVGSQSYNQKLSEQRANTVDSFLVSQGIPAQNVSAVGYGLSNPVADNSTDAGRKENRRVDVGGSEAPAPAQPAPPPPPANPSGLSNPPGPQG